mgnify:FL=1
MIAEVSQAYKVVRDLGEEELRVIACVVKLMGQVRGTNSTIEVRSVKVPGHGWAFQTYKVRREIE